MVVTAVQVIFKLPQQWQDLAVDQQAVKRVDLTVMDVAVAMSVAVAARVAMLLTG
jgi:hypothetical protein